MMSRLPAAGRHCATSSSTHFTRALSRSPFSRAIARAVGELSMAVTSGKLRLRASAMAMHPLPVQTSATRRSG